MKDKTSSGDDRKANASSGREDVSNKENTVERKSSDRLSNDEKIEAEAEQQRKEALTERD